MRSMIKLAAVGVSALALTGCVQSRLHLSDDFGRAVRQDAVAQVAEPDAKYAGLPEAGSHGARVGLAQDRYVTGKVIKPASTSTSTVSSGGDDSSSDK